MADNKRPWGNWLKDNRTDAELDSWLGGSGGIILKVVGGLVVLLFVVSWIFG